MKWYLCAYALWSFRTGGGGVLWGSSYTRTLGPSQNLCMECGRFFAPGNQTGVLCLSGLCQAITSVMRCDVPAHTVCAMLLIKKRQGQQQSKQAVAHCPSPGSIPSPLLVHSPARPGTLSLFLGQRMFFLHYLICSSTDLVPLGWPISPNL